MCRVSAYRQIPRFIQGILHPPRLLRWVFTPMWPFAVVFLTAHTDIGSTSLCAIQGVH